VHALRNIPSALVLGGTVVDTQPVSTRPGVTARGVKLGAADLRRWVETVHSLDRRAAPTIDGGPYRVLREERLLVTDSFSCRPECLEIVRGWRDTQVPVGLERRLASIETEVELHQQAVC
jgi:hypothetical protein